MHSVSSSGVPRQLSKQFRRINLNFSGFNTFDFFHVRGRKGPQSISENSQKELFGGSLTKDNRHWDGGGVFQKNPLKTDQNFIV